MSIETKRIIVDKGIPEIGLKGIYLSIKGIRNRESDSNFGNYQHQILKQVYEHASQVDIKSDPIILGFRNLHEAVHAPNRKNLSAPENLYKLLLKSGGTIPHINLLVDIYNTISVKYKLALGAHDLDHVEGNIHLKFTDGTENFDPIGEVANHAEIKQGYYSYIDDNHDILCYLDVRQVKKTAVTLSTKNVFFIVQGHAETPVSYLKNATNELISLVRQYCGGEAEILEIVDS